MSQQAEEDCHKLGNEAVKAEKYIEAMIHYTRAIKVDPRNHALYSNRSLAFLKMSQFYHALKDAKECIRLQPHWAKGYFRKGEVEFATEHFADAVVSYRQGMIHAPEDKGIQDAMAKAQREAKKLVKQEFRMPFGGIGVGLLFGLMIVLADEAVTKAPVLTHIILKVLVLVALGALGYGGGLAYRYMMRTNRESLLQPPDLYPDAFDETPETSDHTESSRQEGGEKVRRRSAGAARQKYKKGKS